MKILTNIVVCLALTSSICLADTSVDEKVTKFSSVVESLLAKSDIEGLFALHNWHETPDTYVDFIKQRWIDTLKLKSVSVKFLKLGDPLIDQDGLQSNLNGQVFNGRLYAPNLPPIGILVVSSGPQDRPAFRSFSPVGIDAQGSLKFAGVAVSKAEN